MTSRCFRMGKVDIELLRLNSRWKHAWLRAGFALACALLFFAGAAHATIQYTISIDRTEEHLFDVTVMIPDVHGSVLIQMPAWNATYQIRDFASRIQNLRAFKGPYEKLESIPLIKVDKQTWRITGEGKITLEYAILWDEPGPFASQINTSHVFLNLAEALVYVPDRRKEDTSVGFNRTVTAKTPEWNIAIPLLSAMEVTVCAGSPCMDMRSFKASSYDEMVDAPVEVGKFEKFDLEGISPPVHVVVHGENWDKKRLADGLSKIVKYETQMMGGAPYKEYTFMIHIGSDYGGGGMEHANSTAISAGSTAGAIEIAAHEFFHTWNVKRIRPQTLEPVDYTKEMFTRALWFAEGVTSTYASYTEVRTGLWSKDQFYFDLAGQITALQARPARKWESVEESSLDAWFEKYPLHNEPDFSISYYNKGQIVGVMLDILIRDATENHKSLDDVLRAMNENFAKKGKFYNDSADIEATAESVAGTNFRDFFARYVAGTDEVPFSEILGKAGLDLVAVPFQHSDAGFEVTTNFEGTEVVVSTVAAGGPAQAAGIRSGDVLLSLNGQSASEGFQELLAQHNSGETVTLRFLRDGQQRDVSLKLGMRKDQAYRIQESRGATEKQKQIREGMLKGTVN
jgi:predicted metalloprotease with PDZ domain